MLRLVDSGDDESPVVLPRRHTPADGRLSPTARPSLIQAVHPSSLLNPAAVSGPLAVAFERAAAANSTKLQQPTNAAASRPSVLRVEQTPKAPRPESPSTDKAALRFDGRSVGRERNARQSAAAAVIRENRVAARLTYDDPRWLFAVRIVQSLEGGKSAVLGPTGRRSLVKSAAALGLRPFDANLLIAIVQDEVRQGGTGLSHSAQGRINLIREAGPVASGPIWPAVVMAFAIACVLALAMMEWVSSAAR